MRTLKIKLLVSGALVASSLAAVSTVGIAASSATTPTCTPSLAAKPSSVININFWESMSKGLTNAGNEGALTSLVAAFNQAYAGKIHVNDINQTGGYTDTWTQYQAAIKNKTAPQVVMFDQYNTQSAYDTGTILPISACLTAAKATTKAFLKQAINSYSVGNTLEGMPFSASIPVMYYNQNALTAAKIKAAPTTLAQMAADQKILQNTSVTYKGTTSKPFTQGVALPEDPWLLMTWMGMSNSLFANNNNGHTGRVTSVSFNNTTAQNYWTALQGMAKSGAEVNLASSPNFNIAYGNLLALAGSTNAYGKAAITFSTTAALASIQSELGLFPTVKLGVAPLPTLTGKAAGAEPTGGNGLFISTSNSTAAQEAASYVFTQYLTSASSMATWAAHTGYLPIRSDSVASWKKQLGASYPYYAVGYNVISKGSANYITAGPEIGAYDSVSTALTTGLENLLASPYPDSSLELGIAQSQANTAISNYNSRL